MGTAVEKGWPGSHHCQQIIFGPAIELHRISTTDLKRVLAGTPVKRDISADAFADENGVIARASISCYLGNARGREFLGDTVGRDGYVVC